MSRIAYVNGRYVPHGAAAVHVEDRGYQLSDGVYEVCEIRAGRLIDERRHLARLDRSLRELRIAWPIAASALGAIMREVVRRNRVRDGLVYVQVTRGVAPRDHAFPARGTRPSLVVTARNIDTAVREQRAKTGVSVITVPENRWARVDIKTIGLLPNVLAKQQAREVGAFEAWFVDGDGFITEGSSTNAWIVTREGAILTRSAAGHSILSGITRAGVIDLISIDKLHFEERKFTVADALSALEAFLTSATTIVTPVIRIDGHKIGTGRPGPVAKKLRAIFHEHVEIAPEWAIGAGFPGS
jgi:D-alanine transaminase